MSRCMSNEALDKVLRLIEVAAPKKHGGGKHQSDTHIDGLIALGRHFDGPSRSLSGAIREADEPVAARQLDQGANLLVKAKVGDPCGARDLGLYQATFAVAQSPHLIADEVVSHTQCR